MANLTILYWRDIPSQVIVAAAMRSGASGTDEYLSAWRRGEPTPCGDDLETEADKAAARIETDYDNARLARLAAQDGREN
jgi:hypothetical protein